VVEDEPEDTASLPLRIGSNRSEQGRALAPEARQLDRDLWTLVGHMASALLVYGGIGYLLGRWLGHPILLLVGLVFGLVLSLGYTVWLAEPGRSAAPMTGPHPASIPRVPAVLGGRRSPAIPSKHPR
jgi:hypothetical protein